MNELMNEPTLDSTDPDDLAIAFAALLRMRGHDVQVRAQMRGDFVIAIDLALRDRIVASFPCSPSLLPPVYVEAMNRIVDSAPKRRTT